MKKNDVRPNQNKMVPSPPRAYSFEVIIYVENVLDFDDLVCLLKNEKTVTHWLISPLHDCDYDDNGNVKKAHYHVYCYFSGNRSFDSVSRFFEPFNVLSTNVSLIKGKKNDCYAYSCHLNQSEKHLYNVSDIVCDSVSIWCPSDKNDKVDNTCRILIDLMNGVPLFQMAKDYGRDFVIHYRAYCDFVHDMKWQSENENFETYNYKKEKNTFNQIEVNYE